MGANGLTAAEVEQLKIALRDAVSHSFESRFEPATKAGPGVLRVRFAITGIAKSSPGLNTVLAVLLVPLAKGGAATEGEVLDSDSGERLVAVVASSNGSLLKGEFAGFFSEFGHAGQHFTRQADFLRDRVAQGRSRLGNGPQSPA